MENKQTAVEFIETELRKFNIPIDSGIQVSVIRIFEQAKEIEKQQIIDAREDGIIVGIRITNNTYYSSFKESEQYYNETYK